MSNRVVLSRFSDKYINYFEKTKSCRFNILEGAIRSGKSVLNILAFANFIDSHESGGLFVASGFTLGIAWEVLAECRGYDGTCYGLMHLFRGRCSKVKVKGTDAIRIKNANGKQCDILFIGAGQKGSYERLRGLTVSGWIATELELHICNKEDDAIGFMLGRMLGSPGYKVFLDLNPVAPSARMYTDYLDFWQTSMPVDVNYLHCGILDNASLTPEQVQQTLSLYKDKDSIMYKRDILGLRESATGLIFPHFAQNVDAFKLSDYRARVLNCDKRRSFISIGVDFGGNGSNTAFVATAILDNFSEVVVLCDDELDMSDGSKTSIDFDNALSDFIRLVFGMRLGLHVKYLFADSADTVMVNEARLVLKRMQLAHPITVCGSVKGTILKRIKCKSSLISQGRWRTTDLCEHVVLSTSTQVWNPKDDTKRLDDGTCDIDIADAEEYSWSAFIDKLQVRGFRR